MAALEAKLTEARKAVGEREADVAKANEQLASAKAVVEATTAKLNEGNGALEKVQAEILEARTAK